jgi:hypothetical protein
MVVLCSVISICILYAALVSFVFFRIVERTKRHLEANLTHNDKLFIERFEKIEHEIYLLQNFINKTNNEN